MRILRIGVFSSILVCRGRAPFGQHQESRPLAMSNTGSPRFTDFSSLCACSESSQTNLIGSGLNLLCLQIHSKPECRWTWPEVAILGADQKERCLWGRECILLVVPSYSSRERDPATRHDVWIAALPESCSSTELVEPNCFAELN